WSAAANPNQFERKTMDATTLERTINEAWEARDGVTPQTGGALREAVNAALAGLDEGRFRVAEKQGGEWVTNQWLKKAVLLSFRLNEMRAIPGGPGEDTPWWDKVESK